MLRRASSLVAGKLRSRPGTAQFSSQQPQSSQQQLPPDGNDDKHWFVVMDFGKGAPKRTDQELADLYVKTVAAATNKSENDAKTMIYSLYTEPNHKGFGVEIEEADVDWVVENLKKTKDVHWVIRDSYLDESTADYGGHRFDSNGQIQKRKKTYKRNIHFKFTRNLDYQDCGFAVRNLDQVLTL